MKIRHEIPYAEIVALLSERDRKAAFMKARIKQDRKRLERAGLYEFKLREIRAEQNAYEFLRCRLSLLRHERVNNARPTA